jgi:hypothetical protein
MMRATVCQYVHCASGMLWTFDVIRNWWNCSNRISNSGRCQKILYTIYPKLLLETSTQINTQSLVRSCTAVCWHWR